MASKHMFVTFNNGVKMPIMGMGTCYFDVQPGAKHDYEWVKRCIEDAFEAGYRYFDTAALYDTEVPLGKVIQDKVQQGLIKREDLFITTKLWLHSFQRDRVVPALKKSLKNLQLDYVDLYLVHFPTPFKPQDELVPLKEPDDVDHLETWQGMEECYQLGLAKAIGLSNFNSKQIKRILENCQVKPVNNQVESHPFLTNQKLIDFCLKNDVSVTAYCPMAGRLHNDNPGDRPSIHTDPVIKRVAERNGKTPAQVTLRYHIQRGISVIPKSTNLERMKQNLQALEFELSAEDMKEIGSCDRGYRLLDGYKNHPQNPFTED